MPDNPISNEEIDALMSAVQTGEVGANAEDKGPRVTTYDFERPNKFSKEQLRTLEMIYESCARGMATQLSAALRMHAEAESVDIRETSYGELFRSITGAASIALLGIKPLVGRALLVTDAEMCFAFVDRMLGGPGHVPIALRELTELEKGLMGRIVERVAKCIGDAWSTLVALKPELDMIVGNALFSQVAVPDERIVVATFSVQFGGVSGKMHFGVPVASLDPVLTKLSAQQLFSGGRLSDNQAFVDDIKRSLEKADLDVIVRLGSVEITIRDLMDLQVGDLLCLHRKAGADLDVVVGTEVKFRGQPGQVGRRNGVKLTHILTKEEQ